ncbi:MAG: DNA polymerase III subunit epsilon [Rubrivivax sp.]|jgi:DNA polymerase-3 subunit epsilon|nr:DNA polymerase III subunit epsilon [Rubrivivax sp.]
MRQVFLDTETTGLAADQGDRIVEIGCVEMVNRRLTDRRFHRHLNPQRASHPDALRVHGLTEAFLADKPLFADIVPELLEFLAGAEIVIHNAAFDTGFVDAELARVGQPPLARHVLRIADSLALARELYPGKHNSLDALCRRLEVDNSARTLHGALLDAELLSEVYLRMTRGQGALVIDSQATSSGAAVAVAADLSRFDLLWIEADADERAAHAAVLADIDQATKGKAVWRAVA